MADLIDIGNPGSGYWINGVPCVAVHGSLASNFDALSLRRTMSITVIIRKEDEVKITGQLLGIQGYKGKNYLGSANRMYFFSTGGEDEAPVPVMWLDSYSTRPLDAAASGPNTSEQLNYNYIQVQLNYSNAPLHKSRISYTESPRLDMQTLMMQNLYWKKADTGGGGSSSAYSPALPTQKLAVPRFFNRVSYVVNYFIKRSDSFSDGSTESEFDWGALPNWCQPSEIVYPPSGQPYGRGGAAGGVNNDMITLTPNLKDCEPNTVLMNVVPGKVEYLTWQQNISGQNPVLFVKPVISFVVNFDYNPYGFDKFYNALTKQYQELYSHTSSGGEGDSAYQKYIMYADRPFSKILNFLTNEWNWDPYNPTTYDYTSTELAGI